MEQEAKVHLAHCNQGEYEGTCKYGDPNCPALNKVDITMNGKEGKLHLSMTEGGLFLEDCTKFGTSECDECQHRFKCFTQRRLGGKLKINIPLKSLFDIMDRNGKTEQKS